MQANARTAGVVLLAGASSSRAAAAAPFVLNLIDSTNGF
jgi:hypothetical protein